MAKILVVDDKADNRELLVSLIAYRGHQPLEAADGADALALVREHHPDLVISDILMPTMDGYEFVRQMRDDPSVAATEVIFYSAHYREREARTLALTCGVTRVLNKPCEPEDMLRAIDDALAHTEPVKPAPNATDFGREHLRVLTDKLSEKLEDLRHTNQRMGALTELNLHLASEHDPVLLLEKVCHGARDLMGAKYAVLCVQARQAATPVVASSGIDKGLLSTLQAPRKDSGVLGQVCAYRTTRRMGNVDGDPASVGLPAGFPPMHACLIAPVMSLDYVYGWICLADKVGAVQFSDEDERIASTLAAQVGRIYENGILYAEVQQHAELLQQEIQERKRASDDLRASEAGLFRAQVLAKLCHVVSSADGTFESWPESLPRMIGIDPAQRVTNTRDWVKLVHPDDQQRLRETAIQAGASNSSIDIEYRLRGGDGSWLFIRQVSEPLHNASASPQEARWFTTIQDITEQKENENRVKRLNRVYAMLSGINTLIVRVRDRAELFNEACRIAVEHGQFRMAWVGLADWDIQKIVPMASSGATEDFISYIRDRFELGEGSPAAGTMAVRAVHGKRPVVLNDIREYTGSLYLRENMSSNICSMAFLPLLVVDRVVGVLALYSDENGFFDEEEMKLLSELAGDIGFALDHIEKADKLNYLAYFDEITDLPNRTLFLERVSQHLRTYDGGRNKVALALVDIERFRVINDTLGRPAGDELLKLVAERMQASGIGLETVSRVGVNSFGVAIYDARDVGSLALALEQLLRACFAAPYHVHGADLRIAAKVGIALYPMDGGDAETLFRNSEAALKRAKGSAEQLMFYAPEMNTRVAAALDLESRLRTALDLDQFVLYYQPKVNLVTGKVTSAEALIRWNDPLNGLIPPGHFIPILEETGLIYEVGLWALRRAQRDYLRWLAAGLDPVRIAVNVSPLQLRHRNFITAIEQVVSADPQAAQGLELEITESLIMEDVQSSSASLLAVRAMGITVAIDDFGTGYSSLGHLSRLPVDTLKIDRSFVVDMVTGPQGLALVTTIINLAHSFRLKVVAEGVETEEQSRLLRALKCDEMQGYLFSRPVPAEVFEHKFLRPISVP